MSTKGEGAAIVGVGVAACAVCCVGPILGFLAAIGLGTAVGVATFGLAALAVGAIAVAVVLGRRRRRRLAASAACAAPGPHLEPVAVDLSVSPTVPRTILEQRALHPG